MAEAKLAAGEAAESSFLAGASDGKHAKNVKAKKKTDRNKKEEHDFEDDSTKLTAGDAAETSSLVAANGKDAKDIKVKKTARKKKEEHDFEEDSTVVGAVADEASIEDDDDSLRKSTEKVLPKLRTRTGRPDLDSSTFRSSAKASVALASEARQLGWCIAQMSSEELANTLKDAGYHITEAEKILENINSSGVVDCLRVSPSPSDRHGEIHRRL